MPLEEAAPVGAGTVAALELEAGEYLQAHFLAARDDLPHLIGAKTPRVLDHPHDAPVDVAVPNILHLPDDAPYPAVVKIDVPIAQAKGQHVHTRSKQLVDRPAELFDAQGRVEPLGVKVVGVLVVDQSWSLHRVDTPLVIEYDMAILRERIP